MNHDLARYPALAEVLDGASPEAFTMTVSFTGDGRTFRRGLTSAVLSPVRVTEDALEWYGYGSSQVLAGALQEVSGWPLAGVVRENIPGEIAFLSQLGVMTRDGRFVDVAGARSPQSVLGQYASYGAPNVVRETTWGEVTRFDSWIKTDWRDHCGGSGSELGVEVLHMLATKIIDDVIGGRA